MKATIVVQQGLRTPTGPFTVRFCTGLALKASREVFVHAVIDKADGDVLCCTLDGSETERLLEIPSGMIERAAGAAVVP
ncbi:hypothetical protein BEL01nite_81270 [Bradyrhizobium elkanii]|nr:hypothetical protein BEL01nite_81270 [Bradyrhizobium elkanii]